MSSAQDLPHEGDSLALVLGNADGPFNPPGCSVDSFGKLVKSDGAPFSVDIRGTGSNHPCSRGGASGDVVDATRKRLVSKRGVAVVKVGNAFNGTHGA